MRVLAVGEVEELLVGEHPPLRERLVAQAEPARDRSVVTGDVGERLVREPVPCLLGDRAAARLELGQDRVVALRAHHHRDRVMVLRRRADHRRAADVDVLDGLRLGDIGSRDRRLERVEVHAHEVDRLDPLGLERRHVLRVVALREQRRVEPRVEGLDATAEDLLLARELGDVGDPQPGVADRRGGATGRQQLDPHLAQPPREIDHAGLVRDRDQRPANPNRIPSGRSASLRRLDLLHHRIRHLAHFICPGRSARAGDWRGRTRCGPSRSTGSRRVAARVRSREWRPRARRGRGPEGRGSAAA